MRGLPAPDQASGIEQLGRARTLLALDCDGIELIAIFIIDLRSFR